MMDFLLPVKLYFVYRFFRFYFPIWTYFMVF